MGRILIRGLLRAKALAMTKKGRDLRGLLCCFRFSLNFLAMTGGFHLQILYFCDIILYLRCKGDYMLLNAFVKLLNFLIAIVFVISVFLAVVNLFLQSDLLFNILFIVALSPLALIVILPLAFVLGIIDVFTFTYNKWEF